ncbi:MAG: hypothetical protein JWM43_1442 [Acidobacteriaceae bacterium]|nr:hypothetical protein [Acidobacteriaceae bacterium]
MSPLSGTRSIRWPKFLLGALLTAILALSVHVVMLQGLHVPYPSGFPHTGIGAWLNAAPSVLGVIFIYTLASNALKRRSLVARSLVLFLVITMLQELFFRAPIMNGVVTTAWTFSFLSNVPSLLNWLLLSFLIVAIAPLLKNIWLQVLGATALYLLVFIECKPLIARAYAPVLTHFSFLAHDEVYGLPYGMHVLVPAYLTYAEPVLAALLVAALIWDSLSPRIPVRFLQFTVTVLLVRHVLFAPAIYPFYAKVPVITALASMGQFTLETIALSLMSALTWHFATKTRTRS